MQNCFSLPYLFLLAFLFQAEGLAADTYKFNRISAEKGLSNSEVKCIYKDRTGFVWFGTPSGLNRYDGYEMIACKQDLSGEAVHSSNNDIERIQEDAEGRLWLKTRSGYAAYDTSLERFAHNTAELLKEYTGTEDFGDSSENLLYIDLGKNFWFVTWEDIRMYDIKEKKRTVFEQGGDGALSRGMIRDVKQGKNRYWFLYENGMLECMEAQTLRIISRDSTVHKAAQLKNNREIRLFVDSAGDVWVYGIGAHYGLGYYNAAKDTWAVYSRAAEPSFRLTNNVVTSVEEDEKGRIWVGTDHGGVNIIHKKTGAVTYLWHDAADPHSLAQNTIKALYRDDADMMWLGTYKNGACYYREGIYKFNMAGEKTTIPFPDVNCFYEAADKNLWIGANGGGLLYYDRRHEKYVQYRHIPGNDNTPAGDVAVSLTQDREGRLWIGYYLAGLDCFDGKTFTHYPGDANAEKGITDGNAWALHCDRAGNLWVGTLNGGVTVMDTHTGKRLKSLHAEGSVYGIIETRNGSMLVGSQGGLFIYSVITDQLELYEKDIFGPVQLSRYDVNNLFEDSRGLLWIGTKNGLFVFDPYTREVRLFTKEKGLSSDLIQSILEDAEHNMWLGTNSGLTCIRVSTRNEQPGYFYSFLAYGRAEGLQCELFNYNAACHTSYSELIFGGVAGFDVITPAHIRYSDRIPKMIITDFQLYNKSVKPAEPYNGRIVLAQSITQTRELNLNHSDKYFSLSFAALNYGAPDKSRYYYKLEGFNNQWLEAAPDNRKITYTNLNPGRYTFYLKAVNNDGMESPEPVTLRINVRPPFWKTPWAWLLYALLAAAAAFYLADRLARRSEKKLAYARQNMRVNQQLELDEMKLRFFTNISHEFRTPLTLILSPLDDLLKKTQNPEDRESLSIMRRNAGRLLTLVNQLLDFRKLDLDAQRLQPSLGDVVQFVKQQTGLFVEVMARKEIAFRFTSQVTHLYMYFDAEKLAKVLINILSNAYKFTPAEGTIALDISRPDNGDLCISVTDNGAGIPPDELHRVFDRFYQVKNQAAPNYQGSGVGLHIAREFVLLHGGQIRAENVPGGGSRFVVCLPCREEPAEANGLTPPLPLSQTDDDDGLAPEEEEEWKPDGLPKILIVEDNKDLRTLLASRLKEQYAILQAADGREGLELALKEAPDMILSDVMMPRMDGLELCRSVKADVRTSHIPFILLTAKTGEESKLEGLTAGADDYITKPFNPEILGVKMHNLIENRRRHQLILKEQIRIEPSRITVNSLDEKLIRKAVAYAESRLANPAFSVEELSRELGMSRVHLYKKLTSLTGKTPIEFIRLIRLKRAAQLLKESQLTVAEIAYEVGFNNPKYFRKYFKDEFGVLPSQYA